MYWIIGIVAAIFLFLRFLRSPVRLTSACMAAAVHARKRRDWTAAANFYRAAQRAVEKLREPRRSKLEGLLHIEWATLLHRAGRTEEAEEKFRSGFQKAVAHSRQQHLVIYQGYLFWGDLCTDLDRLGHAEQHYRQALQGDEAAGNLGGMIFDLQRLGDSLIRQERRKDAEEVIERAIALESKVVHEQLVREGKDPAQHPIISMSVPDLRYCREEYDEARKLYREKVAFWERQVTRPDNVDVGFLQMRLAVCEDRTGHRKEALEMYDRAIATFEREWGANHPKATAARHAKSAVNLTALAG